MTQTTDEQLVNTKKEFAHQSQPTLAFTQKDMTNEVPAKSAVMKCDPGAGENTFAKVSELITDLITELITDVTDMLRSEASSEAKH